jgi:hypothetical protein
MSAINWVEPGEFEDAPVVLMNRVKNAAGSDITQASTTSVKYKVFACSNKDAVIEASGTQVGTETTETVSSVVFDTLQTAAPWSADSTGYNLKITLPPGSRPDGGWHRVEVVITPTTGSAYPIVWGIKTLPMAGS